jgi:hypothetical protein
MERTLRLLHTWIGLFSLTALVVFAVTGVVASFPSPPPTSHAVRLVDYVTPAQATDKAVADDVLAALKLPLARPIPAWALRRDGQNQLTFEFHTPNGGDRVTVLEQRGQLQIEHLPSTLGAFANVMHAATRVTGPIDVRLRLWALYIDTSIFALAFMAITGPWLWILSRPRLWWARVSLAAGAAAFGVIWMALR